MAKPWVKILVSWKVDDVELANFFNRVLFLCQPLTNYALQEWANVTYSGCVGCGDSKLL